MKYLIALLFSLLLVNTSFAQNKIIGKWKDTDHPEKQIEVYLQNGKYYGKSITEKTGFLILKDLVWNEKENIYKGILTNPDDNSTYNINVSMINDNTFKFKVGKFIFYKTFNFIKIS